MKNKNWIIAVLLLLFILGFGMYYFSKNKNNNANTAAEYETNRTSSTTENASSNTTGNESNSANSGAPTQPEDSNNAPTHEEQPSEQEQSHDSTPKTVEDTISTFTTNIYSSDTARQNNIKIACDTLNDTVVKAGETFSFCNTIGKATSSKGYKKADIFDNDGNKKKGIGGGICQVSSTLYNSILKSDSLTVTERHSHSNKVPYVKPGKDAAVAHRKL